MYNMFKDVYKLHYDALNWYWIITGVARVWSSASMNYVEHSDPTYRAWAESQPTTKIGSTDDLMDVMQTQVKPVIMSRGVTLKSPAKLSATYALNETAYAAMTAIANGIAAGRPLPGGSASFNYGDMASIQHSFTGPQFLSFVHACDDYIYGWTQALIANLAGKSMAYPSATITLSS